MLQLVTTRNKITRVVLQLVTTRNRITRVVLQLVVTMHPPFPADAQPCTCLSAGRDGTGIATSRMHTIVSDGHELPAPAHARCEVSDRRGEFVLRYKFEATVRAATRDLVHASRAESDEHVAIRDERHTRFDILHEKMMDTVGCACCCCCAALSTRDAVNFTFTHVHINVGDTRTRSIEIAIHYGAARMLNYFSLR